MHWAWKRHDYVKTYEIVAVIVFLLTTDANLHLIVSTVSGCLQEILGKKLPLFVKVVTSTLVVKSEISMEGTEGLSN